MLAVRSRVPFRWAYSLNNVQNHEYIGALQQPIMLRSESPC